MSQIYLRILEKLFARARLSSPAQSLRQSGSKPANPSAFILNRSNASLLILGRLNDNRDFNFALQLVWRHERAYRASKYEMDWKKNLCSGLKPVQSRNVF